MFFASSLCSKVDINDDLQRHNLNLKFPVRAVMVLMLPFDILLTHLTARMKINMYDFMYITSSVDMNIIISNKQFTEDVDSPSSPRPAPHTAILCGGSKTFFGRQYPLLKFY